MPEIPIPTDRDEDVYFIQARYDPNGYIKIGSSADVVRRFKRLRLMGPEPLAIIGLMEGAGQETEAYLHRIWDEHRVHGEWFFADHEILGFIDREAYTPPKDHWGTAREIASGVCSEAQSRTAALITAFGPRELWDEDDYEHALGLYRKIEVETHRWIDRLTYERDSRYGDAEEVAAE